ncbi:uncharacterized protein LOC124681457 [Lolium rigidum]|uniref:uncharacterized protein LOC124681457 n=1 Tax=Lolium rigidum TaxID=89674 RepID=UPI001F5E0807|nr:uncharacterized protein LOC124681457 [Lolium rigidum]
MAAQAVGYDEECVSKLRSAQTLQVPDESSWKEFLHSIAMKESDTFWSRRAVAGHTAVFLPVSRSYISTSPGSSLLVRLRRDWNSTFYIRVDQNGSFHTYPPVGGQFQSLQEADNAIDRYLRDRRSPMMCKELAGVSQKEMAIRRCLYWPDGTRKKRRKSQVIEKTLDPMRSLVQALMDQYNENHQRFQDLPYELKDFLHCQYISESSIGSYYHLNFTANRNGVEDIDRSKDSMFFVEVKFMKGEQLELVVNCFCIVEPNDNGHCYGCINNGSAYMKHPSKDDAYTGGHLDTYSSFGYDRSDSDNSDSEEAEETRIRRMYADYDVEERIVAELGLDKDPPPNITEEDLRRVFGRET